MIRNVKALVVCLLAGIGSFATTHFYLNKTTTQIVRDARWIAFLAKDFHTCKSDAARNCNDQAVQLIEAMPKADLSDATAQTNAQFKIVLVQEYLVFFRPTCAPADVSADRFVLNWWPIQAASLKADRREAGFDSLDFSFSKRGERINNHCIAVVRLPLPTTLRIATGQYGTDGQLLWNARLEGK